MNQSSSNMTEFADADAVPSGHFAFRGPAGSIRAGGVSHPVARGTAATLPSRVADALRDAPPQAVIGGALPFRKTDQDYLWCSERPDFRPHLPASAPVAETTAQIEAETRPSQYAAAVTQALRLMQDEDGRPGALRKIVLARTLGVTLPRPIPLEGLMARLGEDPAVTAFRVALPQADGGSRALIGATPELLLEKRGARIWSNPLAGSARRNPDPVADAEAIAGLARSDKDRREHAMVVEYILDTLSPWCRQLGCPDGTGLTSTRSMWHLGTRIEGELWDDSVPSVVLAAALHPTPAVCGLPCERAAQLIDELEPVARDFYAGAVGWSDSRGDGAWYVAIRCADVAGNRARLYAGAGIVPGSDPQSETAETGSKFAAFLRALGLPGDAALKISE